MEIEKAEIIINNFPLSLVTNCSKVVYLSHRTVEYEFNYSQQVFRQLKCILTNLNVMQSV